MTLLISNYAVDNEPKNGENYEDYIVLRIDKHQTNHNYAVTRADYDINKSYKIFDEDEEISQNCFDLRRKLMD
jgi:hypothetical protein